MRQGPDYDMWVKEYDHMLAVLVPLELIEDFDGKWGCNWHDNGDGTYTLTPHKVEGVTHGRN